jgi:hypothetical protein
VFLHTVFGVTLALAGDDDDEEEEPLGTAVLFGRVSDARSAETGCAVARGARVTYMTSRRTPPDTYIMHLCTTEKRGREEKTTEVFE